MLSLGLITYKGIILMNNLFCASITINILLNLCLVFSAGFKHIREIHRTDLLEKFNHTFEVLKHIHRLNKLIIA
jgi:hypothetical protein